LSFSLLCGWQMLFIPGEDYVRLPDHVGTTSTTAAAAADNDKEDDDEDTDIFSEECVTSTSILFASQAQYLGHSNQVNFVSFRMKVSK